MNWLVLLPEYILLLGLVINVVLCSIYQDSRVMVLHVFLLSLLVSLIGSVIFPFEGYIYTGLFVSSSILTLKRVVICFSAFVLLLGYDKMIEKDYDSSSFVLLQSSLIGVMLLISSSHLLTIYMGIELMSLPLYTLVAIRSWDDRSLEAALKYFVTGAIASGFLLFGFALLYAASGSLQLSVIKDMYDTHSASNLLSPDAAKLVTGLAIAMMSAGLAFKLGLFPFHSWLPDVYQAARPDVVLWISTLPKLAVGTVMIKLTLILQSQSIYWQPIILILGVLSVLYGNLMALSQSEYKRMIAYSSISHMGFFMMGLYTLNELGYTSSLIYMLIYMLMSTITFGWLLLIEETKQVPISSLGGLGYSSPLMGLIIMAGIFSLAGVPPFAGFMSKAMVFASLIKQGDILTSVGLIVISVFALGYYLNIVRLMYFKDETTGEAIVLNITTRKAVVLSGLGLGLLLTGILPNHIMLFANQAVTHASLIA
tara:strand:+ start:2616 stop:4061 length:1446 start_codon:yes stop_codon:yes gene_type:complete